jgi:predicted CDP-diglyceride synthetase/phosphatidate cytidylyltransferase
MTENSDTSRQTILLGLGAIIVTLLMASGRWSIFDFGIAISIISFGLYFLRINQLTPMNKLEVVLFAFPFALVTTAALIALFSMLAFFIPVLAEIDVETYRVVNHDSKISPEQNFQLNKSQAKWQSATFLLSFVVWTVSFYLLSPIRKKQEQKQEEVASSEA